MDTKSLQLQLIHKILQTQDNSLLQAVDRLLPGDERLKDIDNTPWQTLSQKNGSGVDPSDLRTLQQDIDDAFGGSA